MKYIYGIDIDGADMWKITTIIDGEIYKMKVLIQEWTTTELSNEAVYTVLQTIDRINQLIAQNKREVDNMEDSFGELLINADTENSSERMPYCKYAIWCVYEQKIRELRRTFSELELCGNDRKTNLFAYFCMKYPTDMLTLLKHLEFRYDHMVKNHDLGKSNTIFRKELVEENFKFLYQVIDMVKNNEEFDFTKFTELRHHCQWMTTLYFEMDNIMKSNLNLEEPK